MIIDDVSQVAVKVLHSHVHDTERESKFAKVSFTPYYLALIFKIWVRQRIRREIVIWQRLNHENVLPLLGTVSEFGRYMSLVSPWMDNGSLMQYLQECGSAMSLIRRLQLVRLSRESYPFS